MKNQQGWIKLHRKLQDNPIYTNSVAVHVWIECLFRACHSDTTFYHKREKITLKAGQFLMGRDEFAEKIGSKGTTIWYWINMFKSDSMIDITTSSKGTVVSILNWNQYQTLTADMTMNGQRMDTNKNDKNVKNNNTYSPEAGESDLKNSKRDATDIRNVIIKQLQQPLKKTGISTQWQDRAFRYADALGIHLKEKEEKGAWLSLFKKADTDKALSAKIDTTYSYLSDYPPFQRLETANHRVKYFIKLIYG